MFVAFMSLHIFFCDVMLLYFVSRIEVIRSLNLNLNLHEVEVKVNPLTQLTWPEVRLTQPGIRILPCSGLTQLT
jgi:hypothetical protein